MRAPRILVTGSSGLVGSALVKALRQNGLEARELDLRATNREARGDFRDTAVVQQFIAGCDGIIQLAAVSRVIDGERDPDLCWATNVDAVGQLIETASLSPQKPWLIFASSREVYGQPEILPADETCPLVPVNVYGRSKVEGERLIQDARSKGMRACTIRLSNVFGSTLDHSDRVVPAFARAAATGQPLRVDGSGHTFDFTHIDDVTDGIMALTRGLIDGGSAPDPIHFVSGVPTTLGELAFLAVSIAESHSKIQEAPPRNFDVAKFVGQGARAQALLGWQAKTSLRTGLKRLIEDYRLEAA
ncbi:MAG: NAD(P)-dependent oxidoreductase [Alphaproteobacteria bacterium]|nr:NAD(P)-dependent oxidoreductase [Alphaproteobacteria bacterium]